ncbi:MAG: hypothetical protein M3303_08620 [Gemmatimonadota bacterium]|nr:hypothetical protein [Gemmatimonadota bacterium]
MLRRSVLSGLVGIALVGACGGDSATGPDTVVGTYTLQTINGQAPPQTLSEDANGRLEITGARVLLDADGRFHNEIDVRSTSRGVTSAGTLHRFGTYVRTGTRITVTPAQGGDSYSMALSGRTLSRREQGTTLVYRR